MPEEKKTEVPRRGRIPVDRDSDSDTDSDIDEIEKEEDRNPRFYKLKCHLPDGRMLFENCDGDQQIIGKEAFVVRRERAVSNWPIGI